MKISQALLEVCKKHAEKAYPNECCGILIGKNERDAAVSEAISADNQRTDSARNRYLIDPREYLRLERETDARGLRILGIYHSHPDVAAQPSAFDQENAWPFFSYLIISVVKGRAVEWRSWKLRDDRSGFDEEKIEILV
jgi:proteasome lid subunit RPN8/RPN11